MKGKKVKIFELLPQDKKTPVKISKSGVFDAASIIHNKIMEGEITAIQVAESLKYLEEIGKQLKEITDERGYNSFTELVRDEIVTNSDDGKTFVTSNGTKMEICESPSQIDYAATGDPLWEYYKNEEKKIAEKRKEREAFLKTIRHSYNIGNILNPETGELYENVELHPVVKTSTSIYKQTLLRD